MPIIILLYKIYKYVYYVLSICVKGEGYNIIIWTVIIILKVINGIGSSRMYIIVPRTRIPSCVCPL